MSLVSSGRDSASSSNDEPPMLPGDSSLPVDLIGEILARLPVKSILRFKCVCKAWNALIMEPQFVKKHYRTADPSRHHVLVVLVERYNTANLVDYSLRSLLSNSSSPPTYSNLDLSFERDFFNPCFIPLAGECHGMLYFTTTIHNNHILYNPSTRKLKILPSLECLRNDDNMSFGFGYDHISGSYKVVAYLSHCDGGHEIDAAIHTLGTDSWRRFNQKFPTLFPSDYFGKFVSGTLNWLSFNPPDHDEDVSSSLEVEQTIVSLDLGTETFQLLRLPDHIAYGRLDLAVGVLKGRLCIVDRHRRPELNVWVMKDYGNRESWTKLLRVPYILTHPDDYYFKTPRAIWISDEDDEILLHDIGNLVVHNSKSGTLTSHGINRIGIFPAFALFYNESLISPCF